MYFRNYRLSKPWLHHSLKSDASEHTLTVNMWKRPKYLPNIYESAFTIFSSFSEKLIWKMCPLVLGEILGVLVSTLTADPKYPVQDCTNLQVPIQMQLSEKRKTFPGLFVPFLVATSNSKSFEKKKPLSYPMYFRNYRLWKCWLDHPLKSAIWEHALIVNI